jgi:ActR/RegA family two-component response regulator
MSRPRLLFVDDDESLRQTLPVILSREGFECTTVATVSEAIAEISRQRFEILLSDLNIGEPGDGFIVVGAMRRAQPGARTYIMTGYPDFASALEAVRSQVDDYLVKPCSIPTLVKALKTGAPRPRNRGAQGKRSAMIIRENTPEIIERYSREIDRNPDFARLHLSKDTKIDHVPWLLRLLVDRLEQKPINDKQELESAWVHGKTRREQGYSVPMIVEEALVLYRLVADTLQSNLLDMDISSVIPDLVQISVSANAMLEESLRSFLSGDLTGEQIAA